MPRPSEVKAAVETLRTLAAAADDQRTKTRIQAAERVIRGFARQVDHEKRRAVAEVKALRGELQDELIAREAFAARVSERQRAAFELPDALTGSLSALDGAVSGSALIEVALRSLDMHALKNIGETPELVADMSARP